MIRTAVLIGTLALLLAPGSAVAQSLLAHGGLGLPAEALDARTRGLGGVGVGLMGWGIQPTDPAAAAGLRLPSVTASMQSGIASSDGVEGTFGFTRFPVVGVAYPFGENVFSVTLGSWMDADWEARSPVTLQLAGEEVEGLDIFRSRGAMSQVRLGWARRLSESLALGLSAGSTVGSLERVFTRQLNPDQVGLEVSPFNSGARWDASGVLVTAGVAWDPSSLVRVGSSVAWSNGLRLSPVEGSGGETRTFSVPMEYRLGGTAALSPQLALALGVTYADWSSMDGELEESGTRGSALGWGAGVEWTGSSIWSRPTPFRFGYRSQQLPFLLDGAAGVERAFTGGLGIHLADFEDVPVARVEIGFQRGTREAGDLSETFLRTTVSVRLAGG
jgi:hypothetical protein